MAVAIDHLLATLALLGVALAGAGWLAALLRLPTVLGYMMVGLALSEPLPGLALPAGSLQTLGHLAVLPVLFFIGLELDLKRIREAVGGALVTLPLDIAVPALAVASVGRLAGWSLTQALALGLCASLSSTLFGERLASSQGVTPDARRRSLGVLLGEDIGATLVLALVVLLSGGAGSDWTEAGVHVATLGFWFVVLTGVAILVLPRLLDAVARTHSHELLVLAALALVVGLAAVGGWAGSAELGALVGGVAAAEAGSRFVVRNAIQSTREVALAVFFFLSGLAVDPRIALGSLPLAAIVAGLFLAAKLIVHAPAGLAAGLRPDAALRSALALGTMGEFNLILVAAAIAQGGANPGLEATIVGAMLILLVATPLLMRSTPALAALARHVPAGPRRVAGAIVESLRRARPAPADRQQRRGHPRVLAANLLLLVALVSLSTALAPRLLANAPWWGTMVYFGVVLSFSTPLVYNAYRAYRNVVRGLARVGDEAEGSARLRSRLVDAWVATTALLLLIPISLLAPPALPVLLGGVVVAAIIVALAGRQLARFHRALSGSVTRVLGQEAAEGELLDRLLQRYPWGIRFAAVAVPRDSPVAGHTIGQSRISELTGATVAVLQRGRQETLDPPPTFAVQAGDTLVLLGEAHQLARAETLVVAHGEALRMSAQSRLVGIEEVVVAEGSPLAGRPLAAAELRTRTGALLAGIWQRGMPHPDPVAPDHPLVRVEAGDRLILLGSPLQVARARALAEGASDAAVAPSSSTPERSAGWGEGN